ncbi:MAG TPA: TIR domain-containing protein [Kiritimatiellia bacterium]|nr:TIR domain-containing protein [Kiritimatiellia bacterium]HMP00573.1 TIR domain-containing protein [Kiritimatiellia bacterium]
MARRCFYSFHYNPDSHRASQIRQIGAIEGNRPASDNDWESVTRGGEAAIKRWIDNQLNGKSCTIVLVGAGTANRMWINYEIVKSWDAGLGVVGIRIHGLKNLQGQVSQIGANPFDYIIHGPTQNRLSTIVKCYNPSGLTSKDRYAWITQYISDAVEEAIVIRKNNR